MKVEFTEVEEVEKEHIEKNRKELRVVSEEKVECIRNDRCKYHAKKDENDPKWGLKGK